MKEEQSFLFDSFHLDLANFSLRRGKQAVFLTPKAFNMLLHLVEHAGQLVTKDDLWRAVWPGTTVTDAALTVCMSEIRKALRDEAKTPQYVETVHRRGYRFVAPVTTQPVRSSESGVRSQDLKLAASPQSPTPGFVGRKAELAQLHRWLEEALNGERQIVFVTGEPGIGKTTMVEAFLQQIAADESLWIGRGQCVEHYGAGEPYLPVLDALGRLCRGPSSERLIELLDQYAPTWLVQMPALLSVAELEMLQRKVAGATRGRMLRELAEAVETITLERPLVLRLEDLHWSDYSTLEWLAFLARRQEPGRLLVLGTYRPVEVIVREHPLKTVKQELQVHGQCKELPLGLLSETAVLEYLALRFPTSSLLQGESLSDVPLRTLARTIHQRTDGNPFFMVNIVDYLIIQRVIIHAGGQWKLQRDIGEVEEGMPQGLQQMIIRQIDRLSSLDRQVLEVASVAGAEFSVAAVAAGLEMAVAKVEERCEALARREQYLRASGVSEWPDGTVAARYGFVHALYQEVVYERVTAGRRIDLHRRIGDREERAYGDRAREIAAELAVHFERGRDYSRAVQYCQRAGENALRRSAHQEAIGHLARGLELLKPLPDTHERAQQELALQLALGPALIATKGNAAPEVEKSYIRARELCEQVGETLQLFPVLFGLRSLSLARGQLPAAHEFGNQLLSLAQKKQDTDLLLEAHLALGNTSYQLGEFALAREHSEQAIALYDPQQHRSHVFLYGMDPGVFCFSGVALALQLLGYPDQAGKRHHEALALAQKLSHPYSLAMASNFAAWFHHLRREGPATQARAEAAIALCTEQGFPSSLALGTIRRGWALAEQGHGEEGIAQIRQGLDAWQAMGAKLARSHFLALLAEAYGKVGRAEEGLCVLAEALAEVHQSGERWLESELYRLKGELTLVQFRARSPASGVLANQKANGKGPRSKIASPQAEAEAEACFHIATEIARKQQAKSLELRAVTSLSRLWRSQGKRAEAGQMLTEIYSWFTEGFETKDLQEVHALLEELA